MNSKGSVDLTIRVLNISPKASKKDLRFFFSYCGTVDDISMESAEDQSQVATVTFRQPYAFQIACLLNGAVFFKRKIKILPVGSGVSDNKKSSDLQIVSEDLSAGTGSLLSQQSTISATRETIGNATSSFLNRSDCISSAASWLSNLKRYLF